MKINWNGLKAWALTCAYLLGAVGGILVACTSGYWLIGAAVAGLAAMAAPYLINAWER